MIKFIRKFLCLNKMNHRQERDPRCSGYVCYGCGFSWGKDKKTLKEVRGILINIHSPEIQLKND